MQNETSGSSLSDFLTKHPKITRFAEIISVAVLALGLILYFNKMRNTNFVLIIGSVLMAITYLLFAFKPLIIDNQDSAGIINSSGFISFSYKLTYLAISITAVGLLGLVINPFLLKDIVPICGTALIIALVSSLLAKFNNRHDIYNSGYYLRIVISLLVLAYLANIQYKLF